MLAPILIALLIHVLTLPLAVGTLVLLLWQDARRLTNLYFAWYLLMTSIWLLGSLLARSAAVAGMSFDYIEIGIQLLEFGFVGSALALYFYAAVLAGNRSRSFQRFAITAVAMLLIYEIVVLVAGVVPSSGVTSAGLLVYEFSLPSVIFFSVMNVAVLVQVWSGFRRIQRPTLAFGMMLFSFGQLVALMSPRLQSLAIAEDVGALAALIMAVSLVNAQMISPLAGRSRQIEVVRDVGIAITSRLRVQSVMQTMAAQAALMLRADACIIFLRRDPEGYLELAAQYNIHENLLGLQLNPDEGLASRVAQQRTPILISDYRREWFSAPDTPYAKESFGSVAAVPLLFRGDVVGVLLVINGVERRIFEQEDVQLLQLLAPQAAVAIINSRLFEAERALSLELETAKTQLEAFLASADNPVIALNRHLDVIFANESARDLVELPTDRAVQGMNLLALMPKAFLPPSPKKLLRDIRSNKAHIYELAIVDRTFLCHVTRIRQPQRGWIAVLNDVTSLKELDRLQRQMIELTTHQLKNPLQGAMLHLDELEDLGQDILTEDMQHDVAVVWQQLERMQRLIDGILNLERLQNRSTRSEQVDFYQVAMGAVASMRNLATAQAIHLQADIEPDLPLVAGDPKELMELVTNLLDNSIKYTLEGGEIILKVQNNSTDVLLSVQDTGIGIAKADHHRIFERFYRVEQSGTELIGGTGMGLSLVKAIVEAHHGQIWLESELQKGSTFFVALPVAT